MKYSELEKKLTAYIETGDDSKFNVYIKDDLPFGFFGQGNTIEDAKADFLASYEEMKARYEKQQNKKINYSFIFQYDTESFLKAYSKIFSMPALEKMTGIHQKQLHHYMNGSKKPRPENKKKIETALHKLGEELLAIQF